jgi:ABC-type Fe3+ transport system substrate-binding protein
MDSPSDALSRRDLSKLVLAGPLAAAASQVFARAEAAPAQAAPALPVETRPLEELHKAALAEGGDLLVYGGGDLPNGLAGSERAFNTRFPGMKLRIVTDRSKFHAVRIDNQLARGRIQCDVAHILTIHKFDQWKAEDRLLPYKPFDWHQIYPDFCDPDGAYTSIAIYAFATVFNPSLISEAEAPRDGIDYLDPKLKGRIVLTFPHDDDSILYQFDRIIAEHGWSFMDRLMGQDVQWIRGSGQSRVAVAEGKRAVTFTASSPLVAPANATVKLLLPKNDSFLSWPHPAAIFKGTRHPEAARLYLSWLISPDVQGAAGRQWPVRRDVAVAGGFGPISSYRTYPGRFRAFLHDRVRLEQLRDQLEQVIGPMTEPNPTGVVGVFPGGG